MQMLRIMSEIMSEGPQNVSVNVDGRKMMQVGQVIVTPITSRSSLTPVGLGLGRRSSTASSTTRHPVVEKVMLKAVSKSGKKASRSFALRNLNPACVNTCYDLKALIRAQLTGDITSKDFDIGYCQGSSVVGLRSTEDLNEVWGKLSTTSLWCDGLRFDDSSSSKNRKRKCGSDSEEDDGQYCKRKKKPKPGREREEEVQQIVDDLQEKHGSNFTIMQLRIWAEMIAGKVHADTDNPPNTSMFVRAGGAKKTKKSEPPVANLVAEAATAITSALSPKASGPGPSSGCSPAKLIESRSKLYKQLTELQNLRSSGILTKDEFDTEKESIMELLKKLKTASQ